MKATGQMPKDRREALKISIAEVSISTKITSRMIQAIETGNMELLPARTFLRGFVKSYATYLKMDQEAVLKSFNEDMALLEPPPPAANPPEEKKEGVGVAGPAPSVEFTEARGEKHVFEREGLGPVKKAALGVGLTGLIALILVVYQLVQKYEKEGQVEAPPPTLSKIETTGDKPKAVPEKTVSKAGAITIASPEEEKRPTIEAAPPGEIKNPVDAKPPGGEPAKTIGETKPDPIKLAQPTKLVEAKPVEVKPTETKPAEVKPTEVKPTEVKPAVEPPKPIVEPPKPVAEAPKPVVEPPKPAAVATGAKQEIIIEALDKVDISFKVNNGETRKISLSPDQVHTIKASGIVAIEMSDGGAVNVIHNGRDVGVPGDLGRPKKIQFP